MIETEKQQQSGLKETARTILRKKNKVRRSTLLNFKTCQIATIIEWYCGGTNTQINETEKRAQIQTHTSQLIYSDKGANAILWRKNSLFTKLCWRNWKLIDKNTKLIPHAKINAERIINLVVKQKIMEFIIANTTGKSLGSGGLYERFLDMISKA